MPKTPRIHSRHTVIMLTACASVMVPVVARAQDRLPLAPGYNQYRELVQQAREARTALMQGSVNQFSWTTDGKALIYHKDGKVIKLDLTTGTTGDPGPGDVTAPGSAGGRFRGGGPARGRQAAVLESPDSKLKAYYKDRNLWISAADSDANAVQVTTDGSEKTRIKYGTASWVYGEELEQRTAFWWSPDSSQIAYYRFDESKVPDYITLHSQISIHDGYDAEAYPKAGAVNPVAEIYVYNLQSKKTTHIDTRDGKPFDDDVVGHYVYAVRWSPDGKELLYNRTDRHQKIMELTSADPSTGASRVVVRETNPAGYTENLPGVTFLKDGRRFLFASSRNGYKNLYLYDLSGKLLNTVTANNADLGDIVQVNETTGRLFYTAHDGDNAMKLQLHRVGLDGNGDKRLTDPTLLHMVSVSPDGKYFVDTAEAHDKAPVTTVMDGDGKAVTTLFKADTSKLEALKVPAPELIICKAADGKTDLYGMLSKPAGFDPSKKYPLLISVYGGPTVTVLSERFGSPNALTALGFLVAAFDNRGTPGRGIEFEQATYRKLGVVDIDDQAAGAAYLKQRPYVDGSRIGIFGTSYGGYASAMALLRHPEVYSAASAMSAVTDWRNYDSVYTERYMGLPQDNAAGYDAGAAVTYVDKLKGKLMIYYGTADDNVHPSNALQLINALRRARKGFEVQVGPDMGHTALDQDRMIEFFLDAFGMWKSS